MARYFRDPPRRAEGAHPDACSIVQPTSRYDGNKKMMAFACKRSGPLLRLDSVIPPRKHSVVQRVHNIERARVMPAHVVLVAAHGIRVPALKGRPPRFIGFRGC